MKATSEIVLDNMITRLIDSLYLDTIRMKEKREEDGKYLYNSVHIKSKNRLEFP